MEQKKPSVSERMKIKPQSENVNFGHLQVLSFQLCENNNFVIFEQKPDEKPMDLRHCLMVIFLQNDDRNWITAEVGDRGNGPEIIFEYGPIPANSKDIGIVNNKQFQPNSNNITIKQIIQYLNQNLAGKYYLLLRDNCYSLGHLIGQQYCLGYQGEAMDWCNATILRTTKETATYIGKKAVEGGKQVIQKAPGVINQGMQMGKNFMSNMQNASKKKQ